VVIYNAPPPYQPTSHANAPTLPAMHIIYGRLIIILCKMCYDKRLHFSTWRGRIWLWHFSVTLIGSLEIRNQARYNTHYYEVPTCNTFCVLQQPNISVYYHCTLFYLWTQQEIILYEMANIIYVTVKVV